jgi:multiple sugar transport system permease protein
VASAERLTRQSRADLRLPSRRHGVVVFALVTTSVFLVVTLFPFWWMLITALKTNTELYDVSANPFWPSSVTLSHFEFLVSNTEFVGWLCNSLIVNIISTAVSVVISIMAGYSLSRLRYRGAGTLGWGVFVTYLIPPTLLFLPLTLVMSNLHLLNSLWSLLFSYPTFMIPFSTWLLMGFFKRIPKELEEAALMDGCTRWRAMWQIAVPLALPGVISAAIFAFTLGWNEYVYALVLVSSSSLKTIPVGVTTDLIRGDSLYWGELMAGALLGSVPVAVLYSLFVNQFVGGLTAGAVKG